MSRARPDKTAVGCRFDRTPNAYGVLFSIVRAAVQPRVLLCEFCVSALLVLFFHPFVSAQSTGTLRIYLARHGETDWNAERRLQGETDTLLNAKGRQQAGQLAESLRGVRFDAVYSSALRRSRETADMLRGNVPVKSLAGLNERRIGKFEGKILNRRIDPATAEEYPRRSRDPDDELDGGESLNQFYDRVRSALAEILKQHGSGTILIVGHGVTNQMILRSVFHFTIPQATSIIQGNDELYLIELDRENPPRLWKLITKANLRDLQKH